MDATRRYQALYFVFFASFSGFGAFRNVFLKEIGMTGLQMGLIGSLWVAGGLIAQPVWGIVADYTQSPIRVLGIAATLSAVAILSYPLGAGLPAGAFAVIAVGTVLYSATRAPIRPIANSLVLKQGHQYAHMRSFGSIAFGASVLIIGFALSWVDVSIVVYVYVVGMIAFVFLLRGVSPVEERVFEGSIGRQAITVVRQPAFLTLLGAAFVMGTVAFAGSAFFSVYMRVVGLGDSATGVAWALKTVVEAIVFLSIARTGLSYGLSVSAGGLAYAVGFAVMGLFPALFPVVIANLSLGAGVALLYFAFVNLAHECAPEALQSTAQTLLMSVGVGAGGMLGQTVAGWIVDLAGVQRMYLFLAVGAALLIGLGVALRVLDSPAQSVTTSAPH